MLRWSCDELPMPGPLFAQLVEDLYRGDGFMAGRLLVHGRMVRPGDVAVPVTAVIDPLSRVMPPGSILPFVDAVGSRRKQVLPYRREAGVALQHVGPLVAPGAHTGLWPAIFDTLM